MHGNSRRDQNGLSWRQSQGLVKSGAQVEPGRTRRSITRQGHVCSDPGVQNLVLYGDGRNCWIRRRRFKPLAFGIVAESFWPTGGQAALWAFSPVTPALLSTAG